MRIDVHWFSRAVAVCLECDTNGGFVWWWEYGLPNMGEDMKPMDELAALKIAKQAGASRNMDINNMDINKFSWWSSRMERLVPTIYWVCQVGMVPLAP